MAQTTSVLWSVDQGLGEEAKAQARQNIGAAAAKDTTNKSEIKVFEGGTKTVHKNLMTIYEDSTTGAQAGITFNNENSKVSMVKKPAEGDDGKVLTVVEPGGQTAPYYEWKKPEPAGDVHYNLYKSYDAYDAGNTSKQKVLFLSESAYNVRGWVSVKPDNGGASIMPLSAGQTDIYTYTGSWDKVSDNINNYNLLSNSYTFIPFAWTTDYPIVAIGIKGNGNVSIGHAFVETIK